MQNILKYDNTISCVNTMAIIKNFVVSNKINYVCIASSQNKFVLLDSFIIVNLSECEKALCFYIRVKKCFIAAFMKINGSWILVLLSTILCLSLTLLI